MRRGDAAVAAARACIGARFRHQGRDAGHGYDCVGVAAAAYGVDVAGDYASRGATMEAVAARIVAAGFVVVADDRPGDLMMIAAGHGQLHLAVRTARGFVHAHAGLRRVVETPGRPGEPVLALFRPS